MDLAGAATHYREAEGFFHVFELELGGRGAATG